MGLKTYYAVKWFVERPKVETVLVDVTDDQHPRHEYVMASLAEGRLPSSDFVVKPMKVSVPIPGEFELAGAQQSNFTDYPKVGDGRVRDPRVGTVTEHVYPVRGSSTTKKPRVPLICRSGWHVPCLERLDAFAPTPWPTPWGRNGVADAEAVAYLVKVSGTHSPLHDGHTDKLAFTYMEMRKKLSTAEVVRIVALVHTGQTDRLLHYLREVDRTPSATRWATGRKGTGRYVLLNHDSVVAAEAVTR